MKSKLIVIVFDEMDQNTQLIHDLAIDHQKPVFVWTILKNRNYRTLNSWIEKENIQVLNITGPSENNAPGIHEETLDLLGRFFPDLLI